MAQAVILMTAISSPLIMTQKAYSSHFEVLIMESARKHLISVGRKLPNSLLTLFNMINISRRTILTAGISVDLKQKNRILSRKTYLLPMKNRNSKLK